MGELSAFPRDRIYVCCNDLPRDSISYVEELTTTVELVDRGTLTDQPPDRLGKAEAARGSPAARQKRRLQRTARALSGSFDAIRAEG